MARFQLNPQKANNFAFFCPNSRLHLTVSNPVGSTNEVTPAIIRGVKSQTLIDIDGVVGQSDSRAKTENSGGTPTPKNEPQPAPMQQQEEKTSSKGRSKGKAAAKSTEPEAPAENAESTANAEAGKAAE